MKLKIRVIVFLLCLSFTVPAFSAGAVNLPLGVTAVSIEGNRYGEYTFCADRTGIYTVAFLASNGKRADCYVSVKQQNSGYGYDHYTGETVRFTINMNQGDILYFDIFPETEEPIQGSVELCFLGTAESFRISAQPVKKEYVIGTDAFFYNNAYVIQRFDFTGAAAEIVLDDGSALELKEEQLLQFIPASSYQFSKPGTYDLKPVCGGHQDSIQITLRHAEETEKVVSFACMLREYLACKDQDWTFNGKMTAENGDCIVRAAFAFACKEESFLNLQYYDRDSDTYIVPFDDMSTYIRRYFTLSYIDPACSTLYNKSKNAFILAADWEGDRVTEEMKREISRALYGWIEADGSRTLLFPYVSEETETELYLRMEITETPFGFCIQKFQAISKPDQIAFSRENGWETDNWNGFIEGISVKTEVLRLQQAIENLSYCTVETASPYVGTGNTVSLYQNGICVHRLTAVVKGDVTGDGQIRSTDYLRIKAAFGGRYRFTAAEEAAADYSGDGKITSVDYLKIKKLFSVSL